MSTKMRRLVFVETPQGEQKGAGSSGTNGGEGAGFTPPASQEDLNRIIAERVSRERAKYLDYEALKSKAAQFDAAEEANKTEAQKQADALNAAQEKLAAYEQRDQIAAWKRDVVKDTHIPADAVSGSTQEEIQAHFELLKTLIPEPQANTPPVAGLPSIGQQPPSSSNNIPISEQIALAEKDKNWELAGQLKAVQLGQIKA
ncbi:hypothetical protein [Timonella sp. A28]|uniref:hypothetical protein n=1 Tax=Timonella sp. A28 TaxID=3442640 RepID=UPI003EB91A22